jgi:hypothetical protein
MNVDRAKNILLRETYKKSKSEGFPDNRQFNFSDIGKQKNIPPGVLSTAIQDLHMAKYLYVVSHPVYYLTPQGIAAAENLIKERKKKWTERGWTLIIVIVGTSLASYIYVHFESIINWLKRIFH